MYIERCTASQERRILYSHETSMPSFLGGGFRESEISLNALINASGFECEFASLDQPPVIKYVKTLSDGTSVEIEFITDEPGNREGVKVIGSINAQALRNVGLLTYEPWEFDLAQHDLAEDGILFVPRPATYLLHKALVAPKRRRREKTAKDLYYIFYVLESFPLWKDETLLQLGELTLSQRALAKSAHRFLSNSFSNIDTSSMDLMVSQRPQTAFPDMTEGQFRQYALFILNELITALR